MKKTVISVTKAARNFADCVNRAHYQNITFVLLKNGSPVARLVPHDEKGCVGRELAEALAKTQLPDHDPAFDPQGGFDLGDRHNDAGCRVRRLVRRFLELWGRINWSALADDFRTFLLVTGLPGMQSVARGSRQLLV